MNSPLHGGLDKTSACEGWRVKEWSEGKVQVPETERVNSQKLLTHVTQNFMAQRFQLSNQFLEAWIKIEGFQIGLKKKSKCQFECKSYSHSDTYSVQYPGRESNSYSLIANRILSPVLYEFICIYLFWCSAFYWFFINFDSSSKQVELSNVLP